jgi:glutamate-ammonia-ligase adenylyltransferase
LHTNTAKALRALARHGLLAPDDARILVQVGRLWRGLQGYLRLTTGGDFDDAEATEPLRLSLARVGEAVDFSDLTERMSATALRVRGIYEKIVLAAAPSEEPTPEPKP